MLRAVIRQFGVSDSAAAVKVGMSASTISRWKREFPDLAQELQQAREECRIHHLQVIIDHSQAEGGRGWRASAWLLERLFPGDYSPRMRERFAYENLEDRRREREKSEALDERLRDEKAERVAQAAAAAQAARAAAAEQPVESEPVEEPEIRASASESDLHNCRNSVDAESAGDLERPDSLSEAAPAQPSFTASESDLHNCRNAAPQPRNSELVEAAG
jgi:hypothetical protein